MINTVSAVRRVCDEVAVANCLEEREATRPPDAAEEPPLGLRERDAHASPSACDCFSRIYTVSVASSAKPSAAKLRERVHRRPQRAE